MRGASGTLVIALHALALLALVRATGWHQGFSSPATPLLVSIVARERPAPSPEARIPLPRMEAPWRDTVPLPEITIATPAPAHAPITPRPAPPASSPAAVSESPAPPALVPPVFDAAYLENPAPMYPPISRRMNETGQVLLKVLVSADGRAERVQVARSSGHERLDRSALEAVSRWRFVPARRGDRAVPASVLVPVNFVLGG